MKTQISLGSLRCQHEELPTEGTGKTLIRLRVHRLICVLAGRTSFCWFCCAVAQIIIELFIHLSFGPGHAKMCLMPYANNKGADQPVHPRSLISTFVVRCLDSMICILAISKVSSL